MLFRFFFYSSDFAQFNEVHRQTGDLRMCHIIGYMSVCETFLVRVPLWEMGGVAISEFRETVVCSKRWAK